MRWIRATMSLVGIAGITVGFFTGQIPVEAYLPLMAVTVTWWFKSRDEDKAKSNNTPK